MESSAYDSIKENMTRTRKYLEINLAMTGQAMEAMLLGCLQLLGMKKKK
jgi:hypothetical protein